MNETLLSGNEALAMAALDAGVALGVGYPGTPSTEILESFDRLGGKAQWAPNEKVALEVALGAAFASARALAAMKHVGLNVAADPLFTAAYTGVAGALIIVSADDPGMASSQNEQDNRHYAEAAGLPMLEPADSQEAYAFFFRAVEISERWHIPVLFRMTARVCQAKTPVTRLPQPLTKPKPYFERDPLSKVMIPAYARLAHRRLRQKLAEIAQWNENSSLNQIIEGSPELGIIASGISVLHARAAAPQAAILSLGLTHPLPLKKIAQFVAAHQRTIVIEEGDPFLFTALSAAGISVEGKPDMFRFNELNAERVQRILIGDTSPEPAPLPGKPPQLCADCPHCKSFEILRQLGCIVAGDIGCSALGVLPPFEAMDTCVCMGASIGVGLGLRHVLPPEQARKVVSVIGDSAFVHSGLTGLADMVYNPPKTGHVVLLLDNGTSAMTGLQEHPGTGRNLGGSPAHKLSFENLAHSLGIQNVHVVDPHKETELMAKLIKNALDSSELTLIIARRPCCLLADKPGRQAGKNSPSA